MQPLAYLCSYKESKMVNKNQFEVIFKEVISDIYPKEFESKKDFKYCPVHQGDRSSLYLDVDEAEELFIKEMEGVECKSYYHKEVWDEYYSNKMSWDEYKWAWSLNWVNTLANIRKNTIEDEFYNTIGVNEHKSFILDEYKRISKERYDETINSL